MTLYEFLKETKVDVKDIYNKAGNYLYSQLAHERMEIDFDKEIDDVTDEELHQLGSIIIPFFQKGKTFFSDELVNMMKIKIDEVKLRLQKGTQ